MNKTRDDHKLVRDLGFSLLAEGTILKIKANGYSMYPSIKPGTTIFIEPLEDYSDLLPGEIIAWKRESGFVVHRFLRTEYRGNEVYYYTRGDSCRFEDKPFTSNQIAGKVIRTENRMGKKTEVEKLISKPCYFTNRIIVKVLLIINLILTTKITKVSTKLHKGLL
jgi:signal peptidase I